MNSTSNVSILSVGMITPLGDSKLTLAAIQAAISAYRQVDLPDLLAETITISTIPYPLLPELNELLESDFDGGSPPLFADSDQFESRTQRMLQAVLLALTDLQKNNSFKLNNVPLLLGLPETLPDYDQFEDSDFLSTVAQLSAISLDQNNSSLFKMGRSSALVALSKAMELIASKQHEIVLIGGVDSLLDLNLIEDLEQEERVLGPGKSEGLVVSEGACVLALVDTDLYNSYPSKIKIGQVGIGSESGHRYSQSPYQGSGLANAFSQALINRRTPVCSVSAGFNGESMMAKEFGVAVTRNSDSFEENFQIDHPADCLGDMGAALGAVQLGLAVLGIASGNIPAPCLVWSSSDYETRAAVCLSYEN